MSKTVSQLYLARSVGDPSVAHASCRGLEVALCELTYYHRWSNINAALGNNQVSNRHTIPDGHYNACELDEEVFQPLGTKLCLHAPTGRLQLSAKKRLALAGWPNSLGLLKGRSNPVKHTLQTSHTGLLSIRRSLCILPK